MKFCKYCGKEVSDDASFCRHCGKRLVSEAVYPAPVTHTPRKKKGALKVLLVVALAVALAFAGLVVWVKLRTNIPPEKGEPPIAQAPAASVMDQGADGFGWLNVDDPRASKPTDARDIDDFATVCGNWNCVIVFEPVASNTTRTRDYATLSLSGAEGNFAVVIDWDYYDDGFEKADQSGAEDTVLNGQWDAGRLTTTGDCAMDLTFFSVGEAQFAVGTMEAVTGAKGTVALYRE